jgi:hypothetical protein
VAALLLAVEQREVAVQEAGDVVTAPADVAGRDLGVGEEGLGLGLVQQRHGEISVHRCSMPPTINLLTGKVLQKV